MFKRLFGQSRKQNLRAYMEEKVGDYQLTMADLGDPANRTLIQAFCTSKCKVVNLLDDTGVAIVLGKYMTWVDLRDKALSPHLMLQGYWEMWITSALARFTKPGTLAIDIGANLGYYTLLMADAVGPSGSVIAFEPNPRLANMARTSVDINDFGSRVSIREEAVGHISDGQMTLAIPRANPQNALIMQSEAQKQGFKTVHGDHAQFVQVKSITLDSLNLTNVGMVKIDAEGAEYNIWRGMQSTIDNNPSIQICLEFNASRDYPWEAFFLELQGKFKQVSHVDFDGRIKPLTLEMVKTERPKGDWMIYLTHG
jgi:FkbM family methyltransferase